MDPILSDPIPKLIHPLPAWVRSHPIRYQSLHPFVRNGSDPIRSDVGANTSSSGMCPTLPDLIPELMHYLTVWTRSYPTRCWSLYIIFRNGSDPIRSYTEAYTSSPGMDPVLSDHIPNNDPAKPSRIQSYPAVSILIPKLIHHVPAWIRSYPIRHRSLYAFFRNGSDPTRSDTEAYTSSPGMDPILSDPIPELIPLIPEWIRPDPIRYRSLSILYWDESESIRSGTGAYTLSFGVEPILSDPIPELRHPLPQEL
jgi:hypothetical protein